MDGKVAGPLAHMEDISLQRGPRWRDWRSDVKTWTTLHLHLREGPFISSPASLLLLTLFNHGIFLYTCLLGLSLLRVL